jgi:hypothetical protein
MIVYFFRPFIFLLASPKFTGRIRCSTHLKFLQISIWFYQQRFYRLLYEFNYAGVRTDSVRTFVEKNRTILQKIAVQRAEQKQNV